MFCFIIFCNKLVITNNSRKFRNKQKINFFSNKFLLIFFQKTD